MMHRRTRFAFKKTKSSNIYQKWSQRQYSGKELRNIKEVPKECIRIENDEAANVLLSLVYDLMTCYDKPKFSYKSFMDKIKMIKLKLFANEKDTNYLCQLITEIGAVESFLDVLLKESFVSESISEYDCAIMKCPPSHLENVSLVLAVVHDCMMNSKTKLYHLRWNYKLIEALFSLLLTHSSMFVSHFATCILEEILLGSEKPPILLKNIKGLPYLLSQVSGELNEASFYHILSIFLFDSDYIATSNFTLNTYHQKLVEVTSDITEQNQEFLLQQPRCFENICTAVNLQRVIGPDQHGEDTVLDELSEFFQGFRISRRKAFCSDLFHLISQLLLGKHREEVQHRIANSDFLHNLISLMEKVMWKDVDIPHALTSSLDDYTPDMFGKIQCLRLIHAIADNHINRYFLLSRHEFEDLKTEAKKSGLELHQSLLDFNGCNLQERDEGAISFIIDKLRSEPGGSIIKFWITRVMEAFLRGTAKPVDQLFFINKNLVEHTIGDLIFHSNKQDISTQGSFDFLSMLMKFNIEAFQRCEIALDCTAKFTQLVKQIDVNLVDSNMFLRCILLTNNKMKDNGLLGIDEVKKIRLLRHYLNPPKLVFVTGELIKLLSVTSLSQDNISCLNTAILILYTAHQDHMLSWYLNSLSKLEDGAFILRNLKTLLQFWRLHYSRPIKEKDRQNLELSTAIKFSELLAIADVLLDDSRPFLSICWHQNDLLKEKEKTDT